MKPIIFHFSNILNSSLFTLYGPEIDLCVEVIALCDVVIECEEIDWSLGEFSACNLGDFIAGAYWAFGEWHAGQCSPEYAAFCALGRIFKPGYAGRPEPEACEWDAYDAVNTYFTKKHALVQQ